MSITPDSIRILLSSARVVRLAFLFLPFRGIESHFGVLCATSDSAIDYVPDKKRKLRLLHVYAYSRVLLQLARKTRTQCTRTMHSRNTRAWPARNERSACQNLRGYIYISYFFATNMQKYLHESKKNSNFAANFEHFVFEI